MSTDATKFNTADLQGKLYPPISDGVDLISIGIGTNVWLKKLLESSLCPHNGPYRIHEGRLEMS